MRSQSELPSALDMGRKGFHAGHQLFGAEFDLFVLHDLESLLPLAKAIKAL